MNRVPVAGMKEALNKFFLKIHPDLLWATPDRMRRNEKSMQNLNEILNWEKQLRKGNLQTPPEAKKVEFYDRSREQGTIVADFALPKNFSLQPSTVSIASRAVNEFLHKLLVRAEVLSPKDQEALDTANTEAERRSSDWMKKVAEKKEEMDKEGKTVVIDEVSRDYSKRKWAMRSRVQREELRRGDMGDFGLAFDGMGMEVPKGAQEEAEGPDPVRDATELKVPVQPVNRKVRKERSAQLGHLAEDFNSMMKEMWHPADVPEVTELITAEMVHYDSNLSPVDCAKAVDTLRNELANLQYNKWYFMPLFVTTRFGVGTDLPGFLSIPYWFTPADFVEFLGQHEAEIEELQQKGFERAKELEVLIAKVRALVPLSSLVIRCGYNEAFEAVERLRTCTTMLSTYGCKDMVIEILEPEWQFGARETGVLQIPADFTAEGLEEFLSFLHKTDQMKLIREAYQETVTKLEEMDKFQRVCYEIIGMSVIDVEGSGATLDEKLQFTKELYGISGELSKYDWNGYTFALGELELDWDSGYISLPHNFHGPNFAKTVHMLHEADQKVLGEREEPEPEELALSMEARRIRAELVNSGLVELDPSKATEQQKRLMQLLETYDSPDEMAQFIRDNMPHYVDKYEEQNAVQMELVSQQRIQDNGYMARRLRRYYKNRMRPRVGPNRYVWELQ